VSATAAVVFALLAGALGSVGLALVVPTPARPRSRRRRGIGERAVLRFVALGRLLRPGRAGAPRDLAARIAAAGSPGGLGPRELMAAKTAATACAAAVALPLAAGAPGRLGALVLVTGPVAGFLAPDLWLRRLAAARARRVRRDLPAMLDLLRVSVEAGASLPAALLEVGRRADGPLAAEWCAVGRQVMLGVPLAQALAGMGERLPLAEVRAVAAALERARRHGAPLGETLAAQARDARFALARRVREDAARAGPKIQLVVALLLVPSVLLLVAAALVSALLDSDGMVLPI
jgi:tight adherence protein C